MRYLLAVLMALVIPAPVSAATPFCPPGFTITLPADHVTLVRGQTFGPLDQYGVPHPLRHTVVANLRLDAGDVAGAVELADELLAIAETVTQTNGVRILYFPYLFDFQPGNAAFPLMEAPWYSGMAQARIAGLFARLHEATGEYRWKRAAIDTYRSLTRVDHVRRVWHREGTARWIDTFSWTPANPVFNGHVYAIIGLLDVYRVLGVGELVLSDAIHTLGTDGHRFMMDGGRHHYDLARNGAAGRYYHQIVWELMEVMGTMAPCLDAPVFYDPA